jgi:dTDP-glucose pyrophosphorylase
LVTDFEVNANRSWLPMNIVITMAGRGERFRRHGFEQPKFCIEVAGKPIGEWALTSLASFFPAASQVIFVTLAEYKAAEFISRMCSHFAIGDSSTIELADLTDGQATSALQSRPVLRDTRRPFAVYNIDTYVKPAAWSPSQIRGDGWIPCFPGEGRNWSFVAIGDDDRALEVREKDPISTWATVGMYWFTSFDCFAECYKATYADDPSRTERYVAPMYNCLIASHRPVYISRLPGGSVIPLGTPNEVMEFAGGVAEFGECQGQSSKEVPR